MKNLHMHHWYSILFSCYPHWPYSLRFSIRSPIRRFPPGFWYRSSCSVEYYSTLLHKCMCLDHFWTIGKPVNQRVWLGFKCLWREEDYQTLCMYFCTTKHGPRWVQRFTKRFCRWQERSSETVLLFTTLGSFACHRNCTSQSHEVANPLSWWILQYC